MFHSTIEADRRPPRAGVSTVLQRACAFTVQIVSTTMERSARHARFRRDVARLHELPDYMLRDIGVDRSEIEHAVSSGGRAP